MVATYMPHVYVLVFVYIHLKPDVDNNNKTTTIDDVLHCVDDVLLFQKKIEEYG